MSILIDKNTKIIVQGLTVKLALSTRSRLWHITPRKWSQGCILKRGQRLAGAGGEILPIYATVAEAASATGATASVIYVPPLGAAAAIEEAIDAGISLITCITEAFPSKIWCG